MSISPSYRMPKLIGFSAAIILLAILYPIHTYNLFHSNIIACLYGVVFGLAIELAIYRGASRMLRVATAVGASIGSVIAIAAVAYLIELIHSRQSPEGGFAAELLIYGFYVGLPVLVTSVGLSLI